jgi:diacylglycerol kinase family enzyme
MAGAPETRVLLAINRSSGTAEGVELLPAMRALVLDAFRSEAVTEVVVDNHPEATQVAESFLREGEDPALLVVGGGGGTLRAVVEGVCAYARDGALPGPERVRIAPLRMGSGNLVAKQLDVPRDPIDGLGKLITSVHRGRNVPVCIGRCDFLRPETERETRYVVGLVGLGQLGRTSGDLERWHRRLGAVRRTMSRAVRLERINDVEYALAILFRSVRCVVAPGAVETLEVESGGESKRLRVLAGAVMNFPIEALPFEAETSIDDPMLSMHLVPYRSRWQTLSLMVARKRAIEHAVTIPITSDRPAQIRLVDRDRVEMFLDEDPISLYRQVTISVAGSLAFVPSWERG